LCTTSEDQSAPESEEGDSQYSYNYEITAINCQKQVNVMLTTVRTFVVMWAYIQCDRRILHSAL